MVRLQLEYEVFEVLIAGSVNVLVEALTIMLSSPVVKPILRMLLGTLPREQRRLLLVASLITSLTSLSKKATKSEELFIRNMDAILQFRRGGESNYRFPVRMAHVFWGDAEVFKAEAAVLNDTQTTSADKEVAADKVVKSLPQWLLFDAAPQIVNDLVKYFSTVEPEGQLQAA